MRFRYDACTGVVGCVSGIVRKDMPRPTKTVRRQKINAALAWKRGEKKEAYRLWEEAAASLKEHHAKKHSKNKPPEEAEAAQATEAAG